MDHIPTKDIKNFNRKQELKDLGNNSNHNEKLKSTQNEKSPKYEFSTVFYNSSQKNTQESSVNMNIDNKTNCRNINIDPPLFSNSTEISRPKIQNNAVQVRSFDEVSMNTKKKKDNLSEWAYRYNKNGYIKNSILEEDEEIFAEHFQQNKQKNSFDFKNLDSEKLKILLNDEEIFCDDSDIKKSFADVQLNQMVSRNLAYMGYECMTPIQRYMIPFVLNGKDSIGCAQTGSGKTIAYLAPIVSMMLDHGIPNEDNQISSGMSAPVALILVPTRELADQIYREARKVIHKTGISVVKVYGGVNIDTQIRELKYGCDILVATPGRLIDHLDRKYVKLSLVDFLVIDEADRMLDMGFEDQLRDIVFTRQMKDKSMRHNLMFSATIPPEVMAISNKFMKENYLITSSESSQISGNVNSNVEQTLVYVEDSKKIVKLHEIFQQSKGNAIVFLETKKSVDELEEFLTQRNYNVIAIHGDKPQIKRQEAIKNFSNGQVPILIATDVASRGLDFPNVSYVINFDMPTNIDDYIHRIGRTGRCGNKGSAISFINEKNKPILNDLYSILLKMKQEIPDWFEGLYQRYSSDVYYKTDYRFSKNNSSSSFNYPSRSKDEKKEVEKPKYSKTKTYTSNPMKPSNDDPPKPMFFNSTTTTTVFTDLTIDGKFPRGNSSNLK